MATERRGAPAFSQAVAYWADQYWLSAAVCATLVLLGSATVIVALFAPYLIRADSAMFQHAGWYVTQGAVPYVDFWDPKPPLVFALTAGLSLLVGGDPLALHALSVVAGFTAIVVGVALTATLAHDLTGDGAASLAAALVLLVPVSLYGGPPFGLRSKYFAFCFGVAALLFVQRDRPLAAGVAAAVGAGFWQFGAGIAALVVARAAQRGGRAAALRALAGGLAVTVAVVVPLALADALTAAVVETVLAPLYSAERDTASERALEIVYGMGPGIVVVGVAAVGWVRLVAADYAERWWVPVGGLAFGALALFVEHEGNLDLVLWLPFLALGVAAVVARRGPNTKLAAVAGLLVLVLAGPAWLLLPDIPMRTAVATTQDAVSVDDYETLPSPDGGNPEIAVIYWQQIEPDGCHYRLSEKELAWIRLTGSSFDATRCGAWPFEGGPTTWLSDWPPTFARGTPPP